MPEESTRYRFGAFELDSRIGELRKRGLRIHIEDQPLRLMTALVMRPGEVLSRDDLKSELWPDNTNVEFDRSLTRAVNKVRTALGDSAANPRFIETLPRRGYRFIAPVTLLLKPPDGESQGKAAETLMPDRAVLAESRAGIFRHTRMAALVQIAAGVVAVAAVTGVIATSSRSPEVKTALSPVPLTSFPGREVQPALSPDWRPRGVCLER